METKGFAVFKERGPFKPYSFTRREPGPNDVVIQIKYCGICHSDLHSISGEWGDRTFPLVPGHEIAGLVLATGSKVRRVKVGEPVGVGCFVDSCRTCKECSAGLQQYCSKGAVYTYGYSLKDGSITQGGYSDKIVVDENYVLRVPKEIPLSEAAPLMCAGITTYSPLRTWGAGPGRKVGVIGLGGLGHMAVKFASSMGAQVTVISSSESKRADALKFGAARYVVSSDDAAMSALAGTLDLIICTSPGMYSLDKYVGLLALDGTLVIVGLPKGKLELQPNSLIRKRKSVAGSLIGGVKETQEMLDYCASKAIRPQVEVVPLEKVNDAYARLIANEARYRLVLQIP